MRTSRQNFKAEIASKFAGVRKAQAKIEEEGREALLLNGFSQWRRLHDG
jgi:hypothetical protein